MARFHRPRVLWRWTESITCFFKPRHLTKSHAKQFEQSIASQRSATAKRSKNQKFCSLILLFASAYQSSLVSCLALGSTLKDSNSDLSDELTSSKLMGAYRAKSHPHLFLVSSSHTSQRQSEAPTEAEYMKYMSLNVCLEVFLDLQDWMLDAVTKVAAFHLWSHVCPNHLPGGIMPIIGGIPWKQSENENKTLQWVHNLAHADHMFDVSMLYSACSEFPHKPVWNHPQADELTCTVGTVRTWLNGTDASDGTIADYTMSPTLYACLWHVVIQNRQGRRERRSESRRKPHERTANLQTASQTCRADCTHANRQGGQDRQT